MIETHGERMHRMGYDAAASKVARSMATFAKRLDTKCREEVDTLTVEQVITLFIDSQVDLGGVLEEYAYRLLGTDATRPAKTGKATEEQRRLLPRKRVTDMTDPDNWVLATEVQKAQEQRD
jgi:hypothetical protein